MNHFLLMYDDYKLFEDQEPQNEQKSIDVTDYDIEACDSLYDSFMNVDLEEANQLIDNEFFYKMMYLLAQNDEKHFKDLEFFRKSLVIRQEYPDHYNFLKFDYEQLDTFNKDQVNEIITPEYFEYLLSFLIFNPDPIMNEQNNCCYYCLSIFRIIIDRIEPIRNTDHICNLVARLFTLFECFQSSHNANRKSRGKMMPDKKRVIYQLLFLIGDIIFLSSNSLKMVRPPSNAFNLAVFCASADPTFLKPAVFIFICALKSNDDEFKADIDSNILFNMIIALINQKATQEVGATALRIVSEEFPAMMNEFDLNANEMNESTARELSTALCNYIANIPGAANRVANSRLFSTIGFINANFKALESMKRLVLMLLECEETIEFVLENYTDIVIESIRSAIENDSPNFMSAISAAHKVFKLCCLPGKQNIAHINDILLEGDIVEDMYDKFEGPIPEKIKIILDDFDEYIDFKNQS